MGSSLPEFKPRKREWVEKYLNEVFSHGSTSYLRDLTAFDDGHYRAVFSGGYFVLPSGQESPSKSQWNNLKKKLKRHEPQVFIFKAHGQAEDHDGEHRYWLDFGFFAH